MSRSLLLVDDDVELLTFLQIFFKEEGFNVNCVTTGQAAKEILKKTYLI